MRVIVSYVEAKKGAKDAFSPIRGQRKSGDPDFAGRRFVELLSWWFVVLPGVDGAGTRNDCDRSEP
jgi:hypothetical protein